MPRETDLDRLPRLDTTEVCQYLASKVRRERRLRRLSQAAFAEQAGIPLRTYKRFETHGQANLETFVRVLQALGQARYLYLLFPQPLPPKLTLEARIEVIAARHAAIRQRESDEQD